MTMNVMLSKECSQEWNFVHKADWPKVIAKAQKIGGGSEVNKKGVLNPEASVLSEAVDITVHTC